MMNRLAESPWQSDTIHTAQALGIVHDGERAARSQGRQASIFDSTPSALHQLLAQANGSDHVSMAIGLPNVETISIDALTEASLRAFARPAWTLQYSEPNGRLLEYSALLSHRRGVRCDPSEIVLTT